MLIKPIKQTLLATSAIAVIIIGVLFVNPLTTKGDSEEIQLPPNALPTTQEDLQELARQDAVQYGLNVDHFLKVESCEIKKTDQGNWDYAAQSDVVRKGVRENSWGAWQINLTAHPDITKEQAQNPMWATEWAAEQWASGNAQEWSCWSNYYG